MDVPYYQIVNSTKQIDNQILICNMYIIYLFGNNLVIFK